MQGTASREREGAEAGPESARCSQAVRSGCGATVSGHSAKIRELGDVLKVTELVGASVRVGSIGGEVLMPSHHHLACRKTWRLLRSRAGAGGTCFHGADVPLRSACVLRRLSSSSAPQSAHNLAPGVLGREVIRMLAWMLSLCPALTAITKKGYFVWLFLPCNFVFSCQDPCI